MSQLKKIIYNCKEATFLIEKQIMGRITFREHIELRIHLFGCSMCTLYDKQSRMINKMVLQLFRSTPSSPIRLDESFKQNLQKLIEDELNKK
jgi:hypothetical protein